MPRVRVIFSRKNSEKGMAIFHKNSGKGYNICKKFQIGSVILITQMTNQKKTELIDFFDLVWTKNPQFLENALKMEVIFSQNSPQNRTLETSIRHKNSEKGPTFSSKIPERVDIEIYCGTPPSENIMSSPPGPWDSQRNEKCCLYCF